MYKRQGEYGLTGWHASYSANPPLLGTYVYKKNKRSDVRKEFNDMMFLLVREKKIKTVILTAFWAKYSTDYDDESFNLSGNSVEKEKIFVESFVATVKFFRENGVDLWIIKDVPSYDFDVSHALAKNAIYGDINSVSQSWLGHNQRLVLMDRLLAEARHERLNFIDPSVTLCKEGTCITHSEGKSLYHDNNHLSSTGTRLVKDSFAPFFVQALAKKNQNLRTNMAIND